MLTPKRKQQTSRAFLVAIVVHVGIAAALTAIVVDEHLQEINEDTDIKVKVDPPTKRGPVVRRDKIERDPIVLKTRDVNLKTPDVNTNRPGIRTDIQVPSGSSDLIQGPSGIPDIPPTVALPKNPNIGSVDIGPAKVDNPRPIDTPPPKTNIKTPGLTTLVEGNTPPEKKEVKVDEDWYAKVQKKILGKQKYPTFALTANLEGETKIRFVLKRDGTLVSREVAVSSGHPSLDNAALQSVKNAAPFPPFPIAQKGDEATLVVPIVFELR